MGAMVLALLACAARVPPLAYNPREAWVDPPLLASEAHPDAEGGATVEVRIEGERRVRIHAVRVLGEGWVLVNSVPPGAFEPDASFRLVFSASDVPLPRAQILLCTTLGVEVVDLVWPHGAAGRPDPRPLSPRTVVLGELPKAHIDAVVKAKSRAVRECYVRDSAFSRRLAGRVTLVFVIAPTGLVDSARVKSTTFAAGDVEACTLEVFRALKFDPPKRGGSVRVTYPFIFTPG